MHLKHLLLLTAFPFAAAAQSQTSAPVPKPAPTMEFGFNIGKAPDNAYSGFGPYGPLRGAMSLLNNKGAFQYGLTLEGGMNTAGQWYASPGFVANYRGVGKTGYWYTGGMASYTCLADDWGGFIRITGTRLLHHGYSFGLQAGRVQQISKRFALTAEVAVRSSQTWQRFDKEYTDRGPESDVVIYLPITVGFRYALR